jgi:phage terminase large subunit-like protein
VGVACGIVATTKRGTVLLRKLLGGDVPGVLLKRSDDLHANRFNLSPKNYRSMAAEFGGTDFHRQEMDDEDVGSSPFTGLVFEAAPIRIFEAPRSGFVEVIVAVDPAAGKGGDHDDWGIGAAGRRADGHVVALDDDSGQYDDDSGGEAALDICERWNASVIIVEANRGPHVRSAIRAAYYKRKSERGADRVRPMPEIVPVTAKDGKKLRAGPLKGLYRQGMLHHVAGLDALEKQQREWDPDGPKSPRQDDRIDWLVHAVHHLADLSGADKPDNRAELVGTTAALRRMAGAGAAQAREAPSVVARLRGPWRGPAL